MNTKTQGNVEFVIYFDFAENHFVGVCLTFNIVLEGDDREELEKELRQMAEDHIAVVREQNLSDELLNRPAPKEYWDILNATRQSPVAATVGASLQRQEVTSVVSTYFSSNSFGSPRHQLT